MKSRRKRSRFFLVNSFLLTSVLLWPLLADGQEYKKWEGKIAEYKTWLDSVGSDGSRLWIKLDSSIRPHRLYVGEVFHKSGYNQQRQLIETFSHYLAGHPEKYMLVDIYDADTGKHIGEFGWGGFKLY